MRLDVGSLYLSPREAERVGRPRRAARGLLAARARGAGPGGLRGRRAAHRGRAPPLQRAEGRRPRGVSSTAESGVKYSYTAKNGEELQIITLL